MEFVSLANDVSPRISPSFTNVCNVRNIQQYLEYVPKLVFPLLGVLWQLNYGHWEFGATVSTSPANPLIESSFHTSRLFKT